MKEKSSHQGCPDIDSLGTSNWQRCQYKVLCCLESSRVLLSDRVGLEAPGPEGGRVFCEVCCEAWHPKAVLKVVSCLGMVKSGVWVIVPLTACCHVSFPQKLPD